MPCLSPGEFSSWTTWALGTTDPRSWDHGSSGQPGQSLQPLCSVRAPQEGSTPHNPSPPNAAQATGSYLLRFGVGVVEDHRRVALPPQVTHNTVVLHPSRQGFLQLVFPFPETEGLRSTGVGGLGTRGGASRRHSGFCWSHFPRERKPRRPTRGGEGTLCLGQGDESLLRGQPKHDGHFVAWGSTVLAQQQEPCAPRSARGRRRAWLPAWHPKARPHHPWCLLCGGDVPGSLPPKIKLAPSRAL